MTEENLDSQKKNLLNETEGEIITIENVDLESDDWIFNLEGKWNGGLCDCFNNMYPSMFCSFFCPAIYSSMLYSIINKNKKSKFICLFTYIVLLSSGYMISIYNKKMGNMLLISSNIFILCLINYIRGAVRRLNNIPGSDCEDVCLTYFCLPCSLSQTGRTIENYGKNCECL